MPAGITQATGISATPSMQGPLLTTTLVSGDNRNPGSGWPGLYGRLDVDTTAGAISWTGLLAGFDGQRVSIRNTGAAANLTLVNQSASSVAANRFAATADTVVTPGLAVEAIYYGGSVQRWVIAT